MFDYQLDDGMAQDLLGVAISTSWCQKNERPLHVGRTHQFKRRIRILGTVVILREQKMIEVDSFGQVEQP
jgi:hypothetical protein